MIKSTQRKKKVMRLYKKDIAGNHKLKVKTRKSEPACTLCMPSAPLKGHKSLYGVLVHQRIDCPDGTFYLLSSKAKL